jgi:membrane fusion protein
MVEEQLAEQNGKREIVLSAPETGTVTALQAKRGGHHDAKVPLLAILPEGSQLEAQLFCSSRAVGFLKVGQRVLLRYEAFPYQKFGHYEGSVTSISHSAVNPGELAPQEAGLARITPGSSEAVYRVTVALASQDVQAYGKARPLQAGMQLEADIVLEHRRLYEWMLEPLYTVTGTWKR